MAKRTTIQVGDKFLSNGVTFDVIETRPGGKVELFDRKSARFVTRLHRESEALGSRCLSEASERTKP